MPFELKLENYKGPLDVLLNLIEEKKMEVTQVSLAGVTADFLAYLEKFKAETETAGYSQLLADFLVVASKLLLIKSKALLPSLELTPDEESEIRDFEARVKLYQELKSCGGNIEKAWSAAPQMFAREFMMVREAVFFPPKSISPEIVSSALAALFGQLEKMVKPAGTIQRQIINLKEKIQEVILRLTHEPMLFSKLHGGKEKRGELVAFFLAVLHLVKQQLVDVAQDGHFEEITITKR